MADGFKWRYNLSGGRPLILEVIAKDTETLTIGDMINIESGLGDLGATADTGLLGALAGCTDPLTYETVPGVIAAVTSVTVLKVIANPDAVYGVVDANARLIGATLDIAGATGAQGVATSSNTEFVVVERKKQTADETRVMFCISSHVFAKAQ